MSGRSVRVVALLSGVCAMVFAPSATDAEELRVVLRSATVFVTEGASGPEGFDVKLLDMFVNWYGRRSGTDVTYRPVVVRTVPELLDRARSGECDLAVGSITITEERDRTVDFSIPYLTLRSVVVARRGAFPDGPLERLLENRRVGTIVGSTHEKLGEELAGSVTGLTLDAGFATPADLFQALSGPSPTIHAAITDITHYWILNPGKDVVLIDTIGPVQGLGFVLPERSPMKPALDDFINELRHSHTYFSLVERHFGNEAAEMVRSTRASR